MRLRNVVNPVDAISLNQPEFAGTSVRDRLDSLPPSLGSSTAFTYLLAALAVLAAFRLRPSLASRRLLAVLAGLSVVTALFGAFVIWHWLTIKIHNFNDENATIRFAITSTSPWQDRLSGILWGAMAVGLSAVTLVLIWPVAGAAPRAEPDDGIDPEPLELTSAE